MEPLAWGLWWLASFLGGAINAVAGGGSFFTFPALVFTGLPSVPANATSNTALWPAAVASAVGYRAELHGARRLVVALAVTSVIGSTVGAILLVTTPSDVFSRVVPWLMLVASAVFTWGGRLMTLLRSPGDDEERRLSLGALCALLLPISIYGGYFGGGQGFLMLALLTVARVGSIHRMNALKSLLAAIHNGVGVVVFVAAGAVWWVPALVMTAGAVPGGYVGAMLARRVAPARVRLFVVAVAWLMTAVFLLRA